MSFPMTSLRPSTPSSPSVDPRFLVRRSEFLRAVDDEFGARAVALVNYLVLDAVGGLTATQAIDAGVPPREVWLALCVEADVPDERRYGAGRLESRQ